jgi:RimJ/RimL family protein N-acetyltransferase
LEKTPVSKLKIRPAKTEDAASILALFKLLDRESSFMLLEPNERKTTLEQQEEKIKTFRTDSQSELLLAELDGTIVGLVGAHGGRVNRNKHSMSLAIGVAKELGGQGIGFQLMLAIEAWAKSHDFHRLELTVMSHNVNAQKLYLKCGYTQEGTKTHSLKVNGEYVDEWVMAKLI